MSDSPTRHAKEPSSELRAAFHDGDPEAMDALAVAFYRDLLRFCASMLGDAEAAAEATQETLLRILENHRTFRPDRPFRPWLFAICRRVCLEVRRGGRKPAAIVDLAGTEDGLDVLPSDDAGPLEELIRREGEQAALAELGRLEERDREVILLHVFEGLTFREIGEALDRPANTAATQYYRALKKLRESLAEDHRPRRKNGNVS
ncbi:sigma-70 family RNA polymerase sigma factor [bacterium]|nr:sigma-70 family RNA polymerase sigma factor [bacterium]